MGMGHVLQAARNEGARVAALCDVDNQVIARGVKKVQDIAGNTPRTTQDFREVLDDDSIDAVVIATPNHWHCPIGIAALLAGKDIYIEKPASHVFREGRLLVEAARKGSRIVQWSNSRCASFNCAAAASRAAAVRAIRTGFSVRRFSVSV